jgi:hypothetical protein
MAHELLARSARNEPISEMDVGGAGNAVGSSAYPSVARVERRNSLGDMPKLRLNR